MKTNDLQDILTALLAVKDDPRDVLVVTHERPDGDAVGSFTAMLELLNTNGFHASWHLQDPVPDCYESFLSGENALYTKASELNDRYSLVFNVDASTVKRLGVGPADFHEITIPVLTLDHHPDNEHFGTLSYADSTACSACEVVFQFAKTAKWNISKSAATSMLLGITTDTGCFKFSNASPAAHRAAAELIELGADNARIIDRAFMSRPFNMAMFEAELFRSCLRTARNGQIVWFFISTEILKKYAIDIRNTEQLIENLRGIEGVQVAALLKCTKSPGIFKISLRSKNPDISVGRAARRMNGGGHEMAAGGTIFAKSSEEAEQILLANIEQEFTSL